MAPPEAAPGGHRNQRVAAEACIACGTGRDPASPVKRPRLERAARLNYDAAKKINVGKRRFLVDCLGNPLTMHVTDGAVQDREANLDLIHRVRALFAWPCLVDALTA